MLEAFSIGVTRPREDHDERLITHGRCAPVIAIISPKDLVDRILLIGIMTPQRWRLGQALVTRRE